MFIKSIIIFIVVFFLLFGYTKYKTVKGNLRKIIFAYIIITLSISTYLSINVIIQNQNNPNDFDFPAFYLCSKVASNRMNFYEPSNYKVVLENSSIPSRIKSSKGFIKEEVNIGFYFPAPTMFLFYPLSFFDFDTAHKIWLLVNILFLIADLFLIWDIFLVKDTNIGFLFSSTLLLILPTIRYIFVWDQTTFIVLFVLLNFFKDRDKISSGIWCAIGIFIHPILTFLFLFFILFRYWKSLLLAIVTVFIICLITIIFFTKEIFFNYFTNNPNSIIPNSYYLDFPFQSLLSTIMRLTNYTEGSGTPLHHHLFIISVIIISLVTLIIILKLDRKKSDWGLLLLLLSALILFPPTQIHYSTLLILPILFLYKYAIKYSHTAMLVIFIIISIIYLSIQTSYTFISNLFMFLIFITLYFVEKKAKRELFSISKVN